MLELLQIRKHRIHRFRGNLSMNITTGPYQIRTLQQPEDLVQAIKLRFLEQENWQLRPRRLPADELDYQCDHLVVEDTKSKNILASVRLQCSLFSNNFHCSPQFNLRRMLEIPGSKIALERFYLSNQVNPRVLAGLLWRGVAGYANLVNAKFLFGTCRTNSLSPRQAALMYRFFEQKDLLIHDYQGQEVYCPPMAHQSILNFDAWATYFKRRLTPMEIIEAQDLLSVSTKVQLLAGARVVGEPALSLSRRYMEFLTILSRENLNKSLWEFSKSQTPDWLKKNEPQTLRPHDSALEGEGSDETRRVDLTEEVS